MSQQSTLEVTDRNGWRKEFPLTKTITNIGSDPRNDIVLETWRGTGVASRHLQIIYAAGDPSGQDFRLVNLGDADVLLGATGEAVSPRATAAVANGQRIRLGDFDLVLRAVRQSAGARIPESPPVLTAPGPGVIEPAQPSAEFPDTPVHSSGQGRSGSQPSDVIGLYLNLSGTRLSPNHPLDGWVTVRNQGDRPGVQFKIEVEGLEPEIYEIGPAPFLFPGAEKAIPLRLRHTRRPTPVAGEYELRIRVTAPEAYPGESATASQLIEITPFHDHTVRILSQDEMRAAARKARE